MSVSAVDEKGALPLDELVKWKPVMAEACAGELFATHEGVRPSLAEYGCREDIAMSVTGPLELRLREGREIIMRLERDADQATKVLQDIERKIQDARVETRAFEEALRLVQSEEKKSASGSVATRTKLMRPGTKVAKVRDVLREAGKPLHIDEIMERMGQPRAHNARVSLVGALSKYVKSRRVFKRTAPNTFGLRDSRAGETMEEVAALAN